MGTSNHGSVKNLYNLSSSDVASIDDSVITPVRFCYTNQQSRYLIERDMGDIGEVLRDVSDLSPEDLRKQNRNLQKFLVKVIDLLKEKADRCVTQEKHIEALTLQTSSLKEVVDITKHMLAIRNTEVNRMTEDLESLQGKINEERIRHSAIIEKMNLAAKLNDELRSEYKQQSERFENMRVKYDEKFSILSEENKRLQDALPTETTD